MAKDEINREEISVIPIESEVQVKLKALELLQDFAKMDLSEKTEITSDERTLLTSARMLALNPFPQFNQKHNPKIECKFLDQWIIMYYSHGISLKRQSRKEIVSIFKGLTGEVMEGEGREEKSKLLK